MESNLFSAEGRIRRSTYLARVIVATAIQILAKFMGTNYCSEKLMKELM
jgi:uncharacterized membrane protein YhaH (DUF805 family)